MQIKIIICRYFIIQSKTIPVFTNSHSAESLIACNTAVQTAFIKHWTLCITYRMVWNIFVIYAYIPGIICTFHCKIYCSRIIGSNLKIAHHTAIYGISSFNCLTVTVLKTSKLRDLQNKFFETYAWRSHHYCNEFSCLAGSCYLFFIFLSLTNPRNVSSLFLRPGQNPCHYVTTRFLSVWSTDILTDICLCLPVPSKRLRFCLVPYKCHRKKRVYSVRYFTAGKVNSKRCHFTWPRFWRTYWYWLRSLQLTLAVIFCDGERLRSLVCD